MKPQVKYRYSNNLLDISNINKKIFFHQSIYCYATKLDFILNDEGIICIGLKHDFITKESTVNKLSVVMAGSIVVSLSGYVTYIDNQSGTYKFNKEKLENSIDAIHKTIDLKHCFIFAIQEDDKSKPNIYNKYFLDRDSSNSFPAEPLNIKHSTYRGDTTVPEYFKYIISGETIARDSWIVEKNNFNAKKYIRLNEDIKKNPHISDNEEKAKNHFLKFGQYEEGRIIDCF
jgi:hypothetical protein